MNQMQTHPVRITHIGGPTALIEIGQLRLLTDPTSIRPEADMSMVPSNS